MLHRHEQPCHFGHGVRQVTGHAEQCGKMLDTEPTDDGLYRMDALGAIGDSGGPVYTYKYDAPRQRDRHRSDRHHPRLPGLRRHQGTAGRRSNALCNGSKGCGWPTAFVPMSTVQDELGAKVLTVP
jgi:hypothetical protein